MELMNPIFVIIGIVCGVVLFFINFNKNKDYENGKKIANTKYVKQTDYYKNKMRIYKLMVNAIQFLLVITLIITSLLIARVVTKQTLEDSKNSRDIYICMDVSGSLAELNGEVVKNFKKMLDNLDGDRVGITIFNSSAVVVCPLTDDYDYVKEVLDRIAKNLDPNLNDYSDYNYIYAGTLEKEGSSIIGDGLASTIFYFPKLEEDKDRTRIIVFSTDNMLSGEPYITLEDACKLCKEYNINLYSICPANYNDDAFKNATVNIAGGKYYCSEDNKQTAEQVAKEIEETKKTQIKTSNKIKIKDHPELLFITSCVCICTIIVLEKKVI